MNNFDIVIVGAGVAGLYTAYKLINKQKKIKICILESTQYIGGRLHTIDYDGIKVDGGGARFNTDQHRILHLIHELGLDNKKVDITNNINYKPINPNYDRTLEKIFPTIDDFIQYMKTFIKTNNIKDTELINNTILEFVDKHLDKKYPTLGEYLQNIYPYYSELAILNAKEAYDLFTNEFSPNAKYMILNGGLQQITDTLLNKIKNKVTILKETPLESIKKDNTRYILTSNNKKFKCSHIILALPKSALVKIKYINRARHLLNSIENTPLYRIYARYPKNSNGKVWFDGMEKISTNLNIKYIIPMNYEKGVIMISYTDGKYANYWMDQLSNGTFETELTKELKLLFPDIDIPKPKWYKHCPWIMGAGYWKPKFNRSDYLHKIIKPFKNENIYICGENYSSHQAWVEGSLETSDLVLEKLNTIDMSRTIKNIKLKKNKKTQKGGKEKEYTLDEVKKHNKKTDAWIVINGIVADVTNWIPKHPGGDIIMKGVGKDATNLFNSIGHSSSAKKLLKKYKIGILAK